MFDLPIKVYTLLLYVLSIYSTYLCVTYYHPVAFAIHCVRKLYIINAFVSKHVQCFLQT